MGPSRRRIHIYFLKILKYFRKMHVYCYKGYKINEKNLASYQLMLYLYTMKEKNKIVFQSKNFTLTEYGIHPPKGILITTPDNRSYLRLLYILGFTNKQLKYSSKYKNYYLQVPGYMLKRVIECVLFIDSQVGANLVYRSLNSKGGFASKFQP